MPVDAGIPLQYKGLQLDNPLTNYAQYQQILAAKSQNKLADLAMGQRQAEIDRAAAEDRAYAAAGDPRDPAYRANLEAALVKEGRGRAIPGLRAEFSEQDEASLKQQKAQIDTALAQYAYATQLLSGATPDNYPALLQSIAKINPDSAKNLPQTYDKAKIEVAMQMGIPVAEKMKQKKDELDKYFSERNQNLNREVTIRGQDIASRDRQAALDAKVNAPKRPVALSATAQKELFEADDTVQSSQAVISLLDQAAKLNGTAYSGYGAVERAKVRSNLPGESEQANATIDLNNIITGQALESLKAIFGGMPTEGERAILMDMQASVDKTPKQRATIIARAKSAAERRLKFNAEKAKALRSGAYMTEGVPESGSGAEDIFSEADAILGGM